MKASDLNGSIFDGYSTLLNKNIEKRTWKLVLPKNYLKELMEDARTFHYVTPFRRYRELRMTKNFDLKDFCLYILVLATSRDRGIIKSIWGNQEEINILTGEKILFVIFYRENPSRDNAEKYLRRIKESGERFDKRVLARTMTEETYVVARNFNIRPGDIPGMVFLDDLKSQQCRYFKFDKKTKEDFMGFLRNKIGDIVSYDRPNLITVDHVMERIEVKELFMDIVKFLQVILGIWKLTK